MKILKQNSYWPLLQLTISIVTCGIILSSPALAHHPLDGRLPANFFEGLMSGFGHPVLGLDHLLFVIASGLIAVRVIGGIMIPIAFVLATGIGAFIHLLSIDLPIPEIIISLSVLIFGILLILVNKFKKDIDSGFVIALLAGLAGIFHGHAYGEGIFGAEPTPLFAYLIGLTLIQLVISLAVYGTIDRLKKYMNIKYLILFAGLAISTTGFVFLSSAISG